MSARRWTVKELCDEARMLLADMLVGLALSVAPKGHREGKLLAQATASYVKACMRLPEAP